MAYRLARRDDLQGRLLSDSLATWLGGSWAVILLVLSEGWRGRKIYEKWGRFRKTG